MTALTSAAIVAAGLALVALAMTLANALFWPRGRATGGGARQPSLSIVIPARNEAANIEACVRAALAAFPDALEVVVYEDQSTDGTRAILDALARTEPRLRVVDGVPLAPGWVGKPHACWRLAQAARGERLLYLDADVRVLPGAAARLADLFVRLGANVVTAMPRQRVETFAERLVVPMLPLTYLSWLPLALVHRSRDPRFLAANGQVLAIDRDALDRLGGFEAVRSDVVDDMALCRRAKQAGLRVVFADGHHLAECRMYDGAEAVWRGFSKNLYEGIGERPVALAGVVTLYTSAFVAPWIVAVAAWVRDEPTALAIALAGVAANLAQRVWIAARHGLPFESVWTHLPAIGAFVAIAINSWRWSRSDRVEWRGRVYASRQRRVAT